MNKSPNKTGGVSPYVIEKITCCNIALCTSSKTLLFVSLAAYHVVHTCRFTVKSGTSLTFIIKMCIYSSVDDGLCTYSSAILKQHKAKQNNTCVSMNRMVKSWVGGYFIAEKMIKMG